MKKLFHLLLSLATILTLCGCQGNWGGVSLKDPVQIPENGVISKAVVQQVKDENAIAVFTGASGEFKYEWTVFGSDIAEAKDINLKVVVSKSETDITAKLSQSGNFGFSALLSIYLNEKWAGQSATAYSGDSAVASVSVTGSKTTILNLTLDGTKNDLVIRADPLQKDHYDEQQETTAPTETVQDDYLSRPQNGSSEVYTNGKDKYMTDPVPAGKPQPVEPENATIDQNKALTCTFSIECSTILNNLEQLDPDKLEMVPSGGVILKKVTVTFYEGESVYDVLQRVCKEYGIHLESSWTPIYNSAYVEGIHNLYEFDCGNLSGWMYNVNGWYPNYGCSRYQLQPGDVVQWRYTCDLGEDVGGAYAVTG